MGETGAVTRRGLRSLALLWRRARGLRVVTPFGPRTRRAALRLVFFAPALLLLVFLVVYPIVQTVFLSFVGPGGQPTLGNYRTVLSDPDTLNPNWFSWPPPLGTLIHNGLWVAIHLPISVLFGLWLALILRDVKGASIVKSAIFLGMVTPMIVGGIILQFLYESGPGIVPAFFGAVGIKSLDISWLLPADVPPGPHFRFHLALDRFQSHRLFCGSHDDSAGLLRGGENRWDAALAHVFPHHAALAPSNDLGDRHDDIALGAEDLRHRLRSRGEDRRNRRFR